MLNHRLREPPFLREKICTRGDGAMIWGIARGIVLQVLELVRTGWIRGSDKVAFQASRPFHLVDRLGSWGEVIWRSGFKHSNEQGKMSARMFRSSLLMVVFVGPSAWIKMCG